jgi:hypothetical protein
MSEEGKRHYRGVVCLYCSEPIAIPARLAMLEIAAKNSDPAMLHDHESRVFLLRCNACRKEAPYRTTEVVDCEGVPRPRAARPQAGINPWRTGQVAKAAHG